MAQKVLKHGTYAYNKLGCRCDICRHAMASKAREVRRRRQQTSDKRRIEPTVQDRIGTSWKADAACRNEPTAWWFDSKSQSAEYRLAMKICATCPVRTPCLEWALQWPPHELHGIWGGTSQRERVRITDQRKAPTCQTPLTLRTTGRISGISWNNS